MERPGALMLYPIYQLLFGEHGEYSWEEPFLELTEDHITISYKTYKSADEADMQAILDQKLAPGITISKLILCAIHR